MKILHIINDTQAELAKKIIDTQSKDHEVKVVQLEKKEMSYDSIVDEIFSNDRVVSW